LADGAGEGIRTPDLLITNQLLYQPELRQPDQKRNYSTSRAICATPAPYAQVRLPPHVPSALDLRRCLTASTRTTPVATDTSKLTPGPLIRTDTTQSHPPPTTRPSPAPSPPTTMAVGSLRTISSYGLRPSPARPTVQTPASFRSSS